jgi:phage FluMu protein Com
MPVVTFSCPECGKVLKSAKPIPAGKKIKCPTCAAVFPMPAQDDEELSTKVSTKPRSLAAGASAREDDDDDEKPRSRRSRDDEDDDDDRPRPRKKAKGRSGAGLLIGAVAVVLLLFLVGGGVGAYFIWFSGVNRGSGNENPLAYVPPGNEVLVSVDFPTLLSDSTIGPQLEKSMREQMKSGDFFEACKKETGLEFKELFAQTLICSDLDSLNNLEKGAMAGGGAAPGGMPRPPAMPMPPRGGPGAAPAMPRPKGMTWVLRPSRPFDQKKMAKSFKNSVSKSAHGKSYYEVNDGDMRTVFMPSDRTLVLSTLMAADIDSIFTSDGITPSVSADTAALMRGVEKTTVSVVIPFEGQVRTNLDDAVRQGQGAKGDPIQPMMEQIAKGKGVAIWGTFEGQKLNLGVNVLCADAAAATATAQAAETAWNGQKLQLNLAVVGLKAMGKMPKTAQLLEELLASLKFAGDGTTARVTVALGKTTLADVVTEAQAMQQGGFLGGFNPGPGAAPPAGPKPGKPK